jgi:hypothetical protein
MIPNKKEPSKEFNPERLFGFALSLKDTHPKDEIHLLGPDGKTVKIISLQKAI